MMGKEMLLFLLTVVTVERCLAAPAPASLDRILQVINAVYSRADRNNDNMLDFDEYWTTYSALDLNGGGNIEQDEYVTAILNFPVLSTMMDTSSRARFARLMFSMGDKNTDGVLDRQDARIIMENLDKDGDQLISLEEYSTRWLEIIQRYRNNQMAWKRN